MAVYDNHEPYIMDDGDMEHISSQITNGIFTGVFEESPQYETETWEDLEDEEGI